MFILRLENETHFYSLPDADDVDKLPIEIRREADRIARQFWGSELKFHKRWWEEGSFREIAFLLGSDLLDIYSSDVPNRTNNDFEAINSFDMVIANLVNPWLKTVRVIPRSAPMRSRTSEEGE